MGRKKKVIDEEMENEVVSKPVKKRKSKSLAKTGKKGMAKMVDYEKQMSIDAQEDADRVGSTSENNRLSLVDGEFRYQGQDMGESITVIIANFVSVNEDYGHCRFDKDDLNSPRCAAIGRGDNDTLVPFIESPDQQAEECDDCVHNQWESAETGKGKACRNKKLLALIIADGVFDDDIECAFLNVPPASLVNFKSYTKKLAKKLRTPLYGVTTKIFADPDDDKIMCFETVKKIEDVEALAIITDQRRMVVDEMLAAPDFSNYHIVEKKTRKKSAGKKTTAKKRKSKYA